MQKRRIFTENSMCFFSSYLGEDQNKVFTKKFVAFPRQICGFFPSNLVENFFRFCRLLFSRNSFRLGIRDFAELFSGMACGLFAFSLLKDRSVVIFVALFYFAWLGIFFIYRVSSKTKINGENPTDAEDDVTLLRWRKKEIDTILSKIFFVSSQHCLVS